MVFGIKRILNNLSKTLELASFIIRLLTVRIEVT